MLSALEPHEIIWRLKDAASSATTEVFGEPAVSALSLLGLAVLTAWSFWHGGLNALDRIPIRRNRVSILVPFGLLLVWLSLMLLSNQLLTAFYSDPASAAAEIASYAVNAFTELALIVLMLVLACFLFARGLKGFGLRVKSLPADMVWSLVYLIAVYPFIFVGLWLMLIIGRLLEGPGFTLMQHQSIELLTTTASPFVQVIVAVFAVVVVPMFEELLFRGYLQTALSVRTARPWLAIGITSLLFTMLHPWQHQVSLFFLSCALGYAYERSGSLLRPIIMHALFNGFSVAVNWAQSMV
ncbi:MAG: CPBP family intramembrane metalloprotease [Planctomycetaceae bacterium]|nr:CPBP family intramembrane metalloprotease [Planctomycetaceae bacterium]